jgi:hypothetical protein
LGLVGRSSTIPSGTWSGTPSPSSDDSKKLTDGSSARSPHRRKGDVRGRVNSESLGGSLHDVSSCYSKQGQFDDALPWFERAVAAKEKGDVYGRVDSESLETSARALAETRELIRATLRSPWADPERVACSSKSIESFT